MKDIKRYGIIAALAAILALGGGCNKFLDTPQFKKIPADLLTDTKEGVNSMLANLYNAMPMEDFVYRGGDGGFNRRNWSGNQAMTSNSMYTDESTQSEGMGAGPGWWQYWAGTDDNGIYAWKSNREISKFMENLAIAKSKGTINDAEYDRLVSETHFLRAYVYFQLAKRYGGVPIIENVQDNDFATGGAAAVKVARRTELDTWNFVLDECDKAAAHLPTKADWNSSDGNPMFRATKWAALALKSRAALYAASLAKYGNRTPFSGPAVDQKLVGINASEANAFYAKAISAAEAIIASGAYSLSDPTPSSPEIAAKNYQDIFMNPKSHSGEIILARNYRERRGDEQGHDYDNFYSPAQRATWHKGGRFSVTLDQVDLYEDYTDNGSGASVPIVTRTDGVENAPLNTNKPSDAAIAAIPFVKYSNPYDAFKGKDARLLASVIVPGAKYKDATIVMQGGLIDQSGKLSLYMEDTKVGKDGLKYNTYGKIIKADGTFVDPGQGSYSGFFKMSTADEANFSSTGFSIRKYLSEDKTLSAGDGSSSTPWIDFRLAEIYLNYAEAVVESGTGDATKAAGYVNALRRRAGHTDNIPLNLANVLKERRVELAFENHRLNDLLRRREYHTLFNGYRRHALVQLVDLREAQPKYVFLRIQEYHDILAGGRTYQSQNYYYSIPGVDVNGLVNNPGH